MTSHERILELVRGAERAPDDTEEIRGATDEELAELERRVGRPLPSQLVEFLRLYRGGVIGPGGIFGQRPNNEFVDLPFTLAFNSYWEAAGWLPVAGDGCGNYYMLLGDGTVGFVDTISDPEAIVPDATRYPDLLTCIESLLVDEQVPDRG